MKRRIFIYTILIFLLSCGPYIWFKNPQPGGRENLSQFPGQLQGKYESLTDSNVIHITQTGIIREYRENLLMTKVEFNEETGDSIPEDTSFLFTDNWEITVKSFGDSVHIYSSKDEELFQISSRQLLREYKGCFFLNYQDTNDFWKVKILKLYGDTLEFDFILRDEDIKAIKNITKVEMESDSTDESIKYYLDPTKRELRKILKRRKAGEKYVKL